MLIWSIIVLSVVSRNTMHFTAGDGNEVRTFFKYY